jgi:hypothetical protein
MNAWFEASFATNYFSRSLSPSHYHGLSADLLWTCSDATRKTFVVPDIKPLDLYDCTRAKICASVGWLLAKSYGNAGMWLRLLWPNVYIVFCFSYIPSLLCNPALFPDCQCIEKRVREGELTARCVNSAIFGTQRVIAHSTWTVGQRACVVCKSYSAPHLTRIAVLPQIPRCST